MGIIKIWGDIDEYENNKICFINPSQVISISASEYGIHVTKNENNDFVLEKGDISILLSNGVIIKPHIVVNESFGLDLSVYDDEDNPLIVLEHAHFERLMSDVRGLRILDAGCGTGRHALLLAQSGAKVTAIDFSEGMLAKAGAKLGGHDVEFLQHDLESPLPFADHHFNGVISGLVVDHITDLVGFFSELRRVCQPGGFVLITVMHPSLMLRGLLILGIR